MSEAPSYAARASKQLAEVIALARETARQGAALPPGCPRELQLREVCAELGAMAGQLGADLGFSPAEVLAMTRGTFEKPQRLN